MSTHWKVTDGGGIMGPGGSMIAVTCSAAGRHADAGVWAQSRESGAEADAHARLIAAAPELLAALEACLTPTPGTAAYNTGRKTRRLEAINAIASAAIAKARRGAS